MFKGWLGDEMVLGKLPVPRPPTVANLTKSKARALCG